MEQMLSQQIAHGVHIHDLNEPAYRPGNVGEAIDGYRCGLRDCTVPYCGCGEFRGQDGNSWMCTCGHAYGDHN